MFEPENLVLLKAAMYHSSYYECTENPIIGYSGYKHYSWEERIFGQKQRVAVGNPELPRKLIPLLCRSFGVPVPIVLCLATDDSTWFLRGAFTFWAHNTIVFYDSFVLLTVIHEFAHWYFWHKYRVVFGHNQPFFRGFIRRLFWKLKKYENQILQARTLV